MTIFGLNSPEIFIILVIILFILGPKRVEKGFTLFSKLVKFLLSNDVKKSSNSLSTNQVDANKVGNIVYEQQKKEEKQVKEVKEAEAAPVDLREANKVEKKEEKQVKEVKEAEAAPVDLREATKGEIKKVKVATKVKAKKVTKKAPKAKDKTSQPEIKMDIDVNEDKKVL